MGVGGHRGRSGSVAPPESRDFSNRALVKAILEALKCLEI